MPPKRRKLSVDDSGREGKRFTTDNETNIGPIARSLDESNDKSAEGLEKDTKKSKSKTTIDVAVEAKAEDDIPKPTRISERLSIKRNRLGDIEEAEHQNLLLVQNQAAPKRSKAVKQSGKQHTGHKKSKRRPWAQWSIRDKKLFFIGLGQYGKNFEAISNKISYAAKQRGLPEKNKMQVRYFYYRCWAKISKFIHLNDKGVKMKTPELYGLINYGVLEKHVKENDPQFGKCLNELILYGKTSYTARNARGKKTRLGKIRTPVCAYLKKINRIEDKQASEVAASQKIPHQIILELTPKNSKAWAKVQGISQNPRVRFKLTANRTLESVFKYLEKKWTSRRVRLKESLGATEEPLQELVCFLHPDCKITPVKLIPQEQQKVDVTFTSYRDNILPTLQKSKKSKIIKESEKFTEEKDKPKDEIAEEHGVVGNFNLNADPSEIGSISKPKEGVDSLEQQNCNGTTEPQSGFPYLLTAAGNSDMRSLCDNNVGLVTAGQCVLADTPVGPKPPTVLMEDENAMFPDSSSFSPTSLTESSKPASPSDMSSLAHQQSSVISSPAVGKKKSTKSSKKAAVSDEAALENCDNNLVTSVSDSSSSPVKNDLPVPAKDLKESSEKEITRLTSLATEGFTLHTSNTVTLLHLSLILGRKSVIKLQYEWKDKKPPKVQLPPLLSQAANQMSNVLRRLCNLATLELTDFVSSEKFLDQSKISNKNVPCSHCGREGSSKSRSKRQNQAERKEATKEVATMTDPLKLDPPAITQLFHPASVIATGGRTFVAGPTSQGTLQINGPDPVFRVPIVPSVKPVSSKEEQLRLEEQQRLQLQAKAIMQQGPSPRNRLLKKRAPNPRNKKTPHIIVQRTLLPKVDAGQMLAYVQPGPQPVSRPVVVEVAADNLVKISQTMASLVSCTVPPKTTGLDHGQENNIGPTTDLLALAAQNAEISSSSIVSPEKGSPISVQNVSCPIENLHQEEVLIPLSSVGTTSTVSISEVPAEVTGPTLNAPGDISMSDLDISMSSVTGSNLGPDAGDKFLDMVLQNSDQGFRGLISTPKKCLQGSGSYQPLLTDTARSFDPAVLCTPPHTGISSYLHPSSIYPSPIKLGISDQPWINTDSADISLSSVLGESSPFKVKDKGKTSEKSTLPPQNSYAAFFETGSTDIPDTGSISFSKPATVTDISLSLLLDGSSFKKDDPGGVSPSVSTSVLASSTSDSQVGETSFFSDGIGAVGPPQLFSEVSQDSFAKLEVDKALHDMVSDSSLDLVSKFEFLAAQITGHQDRDPSSMGEKQEKLLGRSGNIDNIMKLESKSTAS